MTPKYNISEILFIVNYCNIQINTSVNLISEFGVLKSRNGYRVQALEFGGRVALKHDRTR
jgi:hypothetical protein